MVEALAEDSSLAIQKRYIPARMGKSHPLLSSIQEKLIFQRLEIIIVGADRIEDQRMRQQFRLGEERIALGHLLQDRAFLSEIPPSLSDRFNLCLQGCYTLTDVLFQFNRGLVGRSAKRFKGMMPMEDMIQEGSIGLLRAIDRFDWQRGNRFSTYASWWVFEAITRGIHDKARDIRISVYMEDRLYLVRRLQDRFEVINARLPTRDELYLLLENSHMLTRTEIESIFATINLGVARSSISIQQPFGSEDDRTLEDTTADRNFAAVEAQAVDNVTTEGLRDELLEVIRTKLGSRCAEMFKLRYGLTDGRARTLQEIADIYNLSRERVRQLMVKCVGLLEETSGRQINRDLRADLVQEETGNVAPQKSNLERIFEVGKRWFDSAELDQNRWASLSNRERSIGRLFFRDKDEIALSTKRLCLIFTYSGSELEQALRAIVCKLMGVDLA